MNNYVCVIGKFPESCYQRARFLGELRAVVGKEAFQWEDRELLFQPGTSNLPYCFDERMRRIAEGYQDCGNEQGFDSLISVWYACDTFSAEDGLYAKVVARVPEQEYRDLGTSEVIRKVFFVIHNHFPLEEGAKVKFAGITKRSLDDPTIPPFVKDYWIKIIVEKRGRVTQHIFLGKKGESKKVHIFSRPEESPTYENTPAHHPPQVLPFRKIVGVIVNNDTTYSYNFDREGTNPNNPESKKD